MAVLARAPQRVVVMTAQMEVVAPAAAAAALVKKAATCMENIAPPWPYRAGPV